MYNVIRKSGGVFVITNDDGHRLIGVISPKGQVTVFRANLLLGLPELHYELKKGGLL